MTPEQRAAVCENAKYLREVRPIDPAEIHEYVAGQPHPAAVREVLRESALDLGLVERPDRTFVPVADEPLAPDFEGVDRFPERYARELEGLLVEEYGAGWPDGATGDRLRGTIRRLKADYFAGASVEYDTTTALAYAIYHLPDYYTALQHVLADLAENGLLGHDLRVLDVGAGVGGPALGLADFVGEDALVEYHAVEPSAAADVLDALLDATGRNFHATVHRETAEAFEPEGEYDLVVFANVLSELDAPAATAERYLDALAPDGSLVAITPADRETSIGLRRVERALVDEAGRQGDADTPEDRCVYAPTVRLWPGHAPTDRGWFFDRKPDLAIPEFQRHLDTGERSDRGGDDGVDETDDSGQTDDPGDGTFVNADVQFSHFVVRTDGARRIDFTPEEDRVAKLADSEDHVADRVDLVAAKLSHSLSPDDANPLFTVSDGSESVDHYAVLAKETTLNRDLHETEYGALLAFENVLVLWNDDEGAYNLVVDGETVVDRLPVG